MPLTLQPGTTYYWRIVSKTMADRTAPSPAWSFTTTGTAPGATVLSLWPVRDTPPTGPAALWARIRNAGSSSLPAAAKVWFYVTGPNWSGSPWVGASDVGGLASGADVWRSFGWTVPQSASPGTYTYWARVYIDSTPISGWSVAQTFTVTPPPRTTVTGVYPVGTISRGGTAVFWARLRNDGTHRPPAGSTVWFWVTGPNWGGSHWIAGTSIESLAPGEERWFSVMWTVPKKATPGTYTYWAQAWWPNGPLSTWSAGQDFGVK